MKKTLYEDLFERADNYAQSAAKLMECEEDEEYSAVLDEMLAEFDASRTDLADILGTIARDCSECNEPRCPYIDDPDGDWDAESDY